MTGDDHLIDLPRLEDWIGDRLPGAGARLTAERMGEGNGIANALFLLRRDGHEWVLRRPPPVKNHPTASDTGREWRILNALKGTPVPHPTPRLFCEDPAVLGATFMIIDRIHGFTPGVGLEPPFDTDPGARRDLAMAYVDGIVELAGVDWVAGGLEGLGRPEGFLERQVGRWVGQLDGYRTRDLPEEPFLCEWLESNRPTMSPAAILHGDYSPFNVMVAPGTPARLAAIIDWDTGTIGDPLLDIGHLLARWTEPGEEPVLGPPAGGVESYPSRKEMAARYAERTQRDLSALAYYEALALFKLGVILEGTFARARAAGVPAEENPMARSVPALFRTAAAFARGDRE
ncbi:MAG TPA: phosphotransferase family protein [Acidimicrobiales bacterium]|nr:phosphotransferase family protein [Acidimicrobiales bacterium]